MRLENVVSRSLTLFLEWRRVEMNFKHGHAAQSVRGLALSTMLARRLDVAGLMAL
ncbi:MAG: hypothetical protein P4N60_08335 [Verrucomicrobiae bacterium]|nr:hypothetical protein [Verrucomicrobiae bacterium]